MFDTTFTPNGANHYNYCAAKGILESFLGTTLAAEMGSLSAASGVTCTVALPTGDQTKGGVETAGGTYMPLTFVGASLAFSEAVKSVVSLISDSSDTTALRAKYLDSGLKVGWDG
jgi:hypothetical protein